MSQSSVSRRSLLQQELLRADLVCRSAARTQTLARHAVVLSERSRADIQARRRHLAVVRNGELHGGTRLRLHGVVAGTDVYATYRDGRLVVDAARWRAAHTVVALGDVFVDPRDGADVPASLGDGFVPTVLTLIRAADRIRGVEIVLAERHEVA